MSDGWDVRNVEDRDVLDARQALAEWLRVDKEASVGERVWLEDEVADDWFATSAEHGARLLDTALIAVRQAFKDRPVSRRVLLDPDARPRAPSITLLILGQLDEPEAWAALVAAQQDFIEQVRQAELLGEDHENSVVITLAEDWVGRGWTPS